MAKSEAWKVRLVEGDDTSPTLRDAVFGARTSIAAIEEKLSAAGNFDHFDLEDHDQLTGWATAARALLDLALKVELLQ